MHAVRSMPADVHHLVVVVFAVDDRFGFNLPMRGSVARVFSDDSSARPRGSALPDPLDDPPRLHVEHQQPQLQAGDYHLPEPLHEQALIDVTGRRKVKDAFRLILRQHGPVNIVLTDCLLQVAYDRAAEETLNLDGDPSPLSLGRDGRSLGAEIDVESLPP